MAIEWSEWSSNGQSGHRMVRVVIEWSEWPESEVPKTSTNGKENNGQKTTNSPVWFDSYLLG